MAQQEDHATYVSYAQALLELADARGVTDQVAGDLQAVAQAVSGDAALAKYFADPTVSSTERAAKIDSAFGGKTPDVLVGFLKLVNVKGRLGALSAISAAFKKLLDARSGRVDVEVTVAHQLNDGELEDVRRQISTKLGKDAIVTQKVDDSIIGGLVLKIGDKLIDGSVKSQLEQLKRRLVAAV